MRSNAEAIYAETPVLVETLAETLGTSPMDVAFHLADAKQDAERTPLNSFIDEFILTA